MIYRHHLTFTRNCLHKGPKHVMTASFASRTLHELINNMARTVNRPCLGHLPPLAWEQAMGQGMKERAIRLRAIDRREQSRLSQAELRVELHEMAVKKAEVFDENGENGLWTTEVEL
jgi:hypothetical protein